MDPRPPHPQPSADAPVTVVVPTYNEEAWITDCLASLLRQDHPAMAILVVDGRSDDRTRSIVERVAAADPRVELVDNPKGTAAAAMNVGLAHTTTDLLVRADAHAVYAPDYVRRNVEVLLDTGAADVGGPMRPVGTTRFGQAVAAVTSTRIGMGSGAFHWADSRRVVDTVYLGCYRTDLLRRVGGWDDEGLQWAAEDQELNFRIRRSGGTIVLDPTIRSWYFPRDSPRALWRQYRNYGVCKVSTLVKHRSLPTLRPLAPAALVGGASVALAAAAVTRRPILASPIAVWLALVGITGLRLSSQPGVRAHQAAGALAICHWSYGVGFWRAVGRVALRRPFETRPRGHR